MRKLLAVIASLTIPIGFCIAQSIVTKVELYTLSSDSLTSEIVLQMPYAGFEIENIQGDTALLHRAGAIMIDIVCTDYPAHLSLNELNRKRVEAFFNLFPYINKQQVSNINIYRQLKGSAKPIAENMFHGIVIKFRPAQDITLMEHDIKKLIELITPLPTVPQPVSDLSKKELNDIEIPEVKNDTITIADTLHPEDVEMHSFSVVEITVFYGATSEIVKKFKKRGKFFKDADSMQVVTPAEALKQGLDKKSYNDYSKYDKITIFFKKVRDTIYAHDKAYREFDFSGIDSFYHPQPDSTLFKIFNRNTWNNTAVVSDVTGSMFPYGAQLLLWLKLNSLDSFTNRFTFFNDGDIKPDEEKIIGNTKGIYNKICHSFDEVKALMIHTMQKGSGGDLPENNIEALLKTEEEYPQIDYTILIADNWANIKDKVLIPQLKKPVRIVLCGVMNDLINTDYLNLARKTRGSIHLMDEDLMELASLHEGEEIKIGYRVYKIVKGNFMEINHL